MQKLEREIRLLANEIGLKSVENEDSVKQEECLQLFKDQEVVINGAKVGVYLYVSNGELKLQLSHREQGEPLGGVPVRHRTSLLDIKKAENTDYALRPLLNAVDEMFEE